HLTLNLSINHLISENEGRQTKLTLEEASATFTLKPSNGKSESQTDCIGEKLVKNEEAVEIKKEADKLGAAQEARKKKIEIVTVNADTCAKNNTGIVATNENLKWNKREMWMSASEIMAATLSMIYFSFPAQWPSAWRARQEVLSYRSLAFGKETGFGVTADGQVLAWGRPRSRNSKSLCKAKKVVASSYGGAALDDNGSVYVVPTVTPKSFTYLKKFWFSEPHVILGGNDYAVDISGGSRGIIVLLRSGKVMLVGDPRTSDDEKECSKKPGQTLVLPEWFEANGVFAGKSEAIYVRGVMLGVEQILVRRHREGKKAEFEVLDTRQIGGVEVMVPYEDHVMVITANHKIYRAEHGSSNFKEASITPGHEWRFRV
ncbi:hypothetical protein BC829DRAFT_403422, partial [Chytridium lagenaria]